MNAVDIDTMSWEGIEADRTKWRIALKQHLKTGEYKLMAATADKRAPRKEGSSSIQPETTHRCNVCNKDCYSNIDLSRAFDTIRRDKLFTRAATLNRRLPRIRDIYRHASRGQAQPRVVYGLP